MSQPQDDNSKAKIIPLRSLIADLQTDADEAYAAQQNGLLRGPITGLKRVDQHISGWMAPGLHITHGQPGTGKTALALQIAASCQCPCLYVTCEMAPLELFKRHMARVTKTYLGRLKSGEMEPKDVMALAKAAIEAAPMLTFVDATQAPASVDFLRKCVDVARQGERNFLMVVDSLHSWAESAGGELSEYETLNLALRGLRTLSHQLSIPILVVSERNRESMKSGGLSAGAGTRKIEYGAETVMDLGRDENAREGFSGDIEVTLKFSKNRHGAAGGTVKLMFNGPLQTFTEI